MSLRRFHSLLVRLTILLTTSTAGAAHAAVLFSNFGPNDTYLPHAETALVWANSTGGVVEHAAKFTVPGAYSWEFDSVEVPFSTRSLNSTPGVNLWLMADNGGLPGAILETLVLGPTTLTPTIYNVASTQNSVLSPGQSYWIGATPTSISDQGADWHDNPIGQNDGRALRISQSVGWFLDSDGQPRPTMRINGSPQIPECVVTNSSFELIEATFGGLPQNYSNWQGDLSQIVTGTTQGITPHSGQRMLNFDGTTAFGSGSNTSAVWQLVDVSHLSSEIAAGNVEVELEFYANRIAGDANTDTLFQAVMHAQSGAVNDFPFEIANYLDLAGTNLFSDSDPDTWELVQTSMVLPAGTDYLAVSVRAGENVFDDSREEFDGHFADSVCVRLKVVPEPSAIALVALGAATMLAITRH